MSLLPTLLGKQCKWCVMRAIWCEVFWLVADSWGIRRTKGMEPLRMLAVCRWWIVLFVGTHFSLRWSCCVASPTLVTCRTVIDPWGGQILS